MAAVTTYSDREAFGRFFLEDVLTWIEDNIEPDQIWTDERIATFVVDGAPGILHDIMEHIGQNYSPEDVFTGEQLNEWAMEALGLKQ